MRSESDSALKDLNKRKPPGIDKIPEKLLRIAGDESLDKLFNPVGKIYESPKSPES